MTARFDDSQIRSIAELEAFLAATKVCSLKAAVPRKERAQWIRGHLLRFRYRTLQRKQKRILREYLCAVTGLKERTLKYHVTAYLDGKTICAPYKRNRFPCAYTQTDRELLAETDNLHGRLNSDATRAILRDMHGSGDARYARLRKISNSHLYNLRQSRVYRDRALTIAKTKPVQVPIGKREKPEPEGQPGFIRVDTVHQGDQDGEKGVYHINLVDEVVQWEVIVAVPDISEQFLVPVLAEALELFPFAIQNFHSDNGGEYINKTVAALLNKLLIRQTKGRPRRSNDNGLAETKNGAIIRKHMGYWHIPKKWTPRINRFYREHFIPYINFYRPCGFPTETRLPNGKKKITYKDYRTPLQKLLSIKHVEQYLRSSITAESLRAMVARKTPNQAAAEMQEAKRELFKMIGDNLSEGNQ